MLSRLPSLLVITKAKIDGSNKVFGYHSAKNATTFNATLICLWNRRCSVPKWAFKNSFCYSKPFSIIISQRKLSTFRTIQVASKNRKTSTTHLICVCAHRLYNDNYNYRFVCWSDTRVLWALATCNFQ